MFSFSYLLFFLGRKSSHLVLLYKGYFSFQVICLLHYPNDCSFLSILTLHSFFLLEFIIHISLAFLGYFFFVALTSLLLLFKVILISLFVYCNWFFFSLLEMATLEYERLALYGGSGSKVLNVVHLTIIYPFANIIVLSDRYESRGVRHVTPYIKGVS